MHVAIIGAGFSGVLAAYLLRRRGVRVTIFEKEKSIGGHCNTLTIQNSYIELGTICSFSKNIKELLIELEIDYTERVIYKHFVDVNYNKTEHMSKNEVEELLLEIPRVKELLESFSDTLQDINFGFIDPILLKPFGQFIKEFNLPSIGKFFRPYLSSFGFGDVDTIQTYYIFKIFNIEMIYSYMQGRKVVFFNNGVSELIDKLSRNISNIRFALEVNNIEVEQDRVKVETPYSSEIFDKVFITTKLPRDVIKDNLYNSLMKKIETNPFITCLYEIKDSDSVTTYFKDNQGLWGKTQFFRITRENNRTNLIAYAYGRVDKEIIDGITNDIKSLGISISHLITVNQWFMFPHLKQENLTPNFYKDINNHQKNSNICLMGSLLSLPSLDSLYTSIKNSVDKIMG
ncbi:NAD(P)/FAD-dependent oxidoreductase [Thiospirochaeta perfilievii]|uniref:NAD(P)/FAD-dependent oxidoreductase n=1 Tax=Thiospirochaeta perfilievii TaxID=252967 RepID=A0A5C1Q7Q4_9SPIO|nr:FAD-dependent oxidoreductase [Thiospirochaeta perfilievii]QEN03471.1 NAD(P)/FAD-dependent oxidoreductase [Thiospirochaeta perfilievii]